MLYIIIYLVTFENLSDSCSSLSLTKKSRKGKVVKVVIALLVFPKSLNDEAAMDHPDVSMVYPC